MSDRLQGWAVASRVHQPATCGGMSGTCKRERRGALLSLRCHATGKPGMEAIAVGSGPTMPLPSVCQTGRGTFKVGCRNYGSAARPLAVLEAVTRFASVVSYGVHSSSPMVDRIYRCVMRARAVGLSFFSISTGAWCV